MSTAHDRPGASLSSLATELLERPEFAVLSTINDDGSVHQCVMWVEEDDGDLLLSSRVGRPQVRNLERDPRGSVLLHDRRDPVRYVHVTGLVHVAQDDGSTIDRLSRRYVGVPHVSAAGGAGDDRVTLRLTPSRVVDHPRSAR